MSTPASGWRNPSNLPPPFVSPPPTFELRLVSKAEVQPLQALVLAGEDVVVLLLLGHGGPLGLADPVAPDVEGLDGVEHDDVPPGDSEQDLVATPVVGRVVGAVDVGRHHGAGLDEHVVDWVIS